MKQLFIRFQVVFLLCLTGTLLLGLQQALAYAIPLPGAAQTMAAVATPIAPTDGKPPFTNGQPITVPVFVAPNAKPVAVPNAADALLAPQITFWYGNQQTFGQWGNPQQWVNVLGNVASAARIRTVSYTLNGGTPQPLALGLDKRRLAEDGDFNVELNINDLLNGPNQVTVTATDRNNLSTTATMTVNYTTGKNWPLPYTADWAATPNIHAVAQIVDGQWTKTGDTIRPLVFEYDRLIGIGDMSWSSYEVVVPITIHAIDEEGFNYPSSGPGVGILLRWRGHYQDTDEQPRIGWRNLGALAWFRWGKDDNNNMIAGAEILGYYGSRITMAPHVQPAFNLPYLMRTQVEAVASGGDTYRFKVWPADQAEPAAWQMTGQGFVGEPETGSFMLVAHETDASFGKVEVCPLQAGGDNSFRPTLSVVGEGQITLSSDQANYRCGETLTLRATPALGWRFLAWGGAASGEQNPYNLSIRGAQQVSATFVRDRYALNVTTTGDGQVNLTPPQADYAFGQQVMLSAGATSGWRFAGWEGDLSGNVNPAMITITQTKNIAAIFTPLVPTQTYTLTTAVVGNGAVTRTPAQGPYLEGTVITLTVQPAAGWQFAGWQFAGTVNPVTDNPTTVVMNDNRVVTATFVPLNHSVAITVVGSGTVAGAPALANHPHGTVLTLQAQPAPGWQFAGWQGDLAGSQSPLTFTVNGPQQITAVFVAEEPTTYSLLTSTSEGGFVTIAPALASYPAGTPVSITATPTSGWRFVRWQGDVDSTLNPLPLTMNRSYAVQALFSRTTVGLSTAVEGPGLIETSLPVGSHPFGTQVTLTATAALGSSFLGWAGDLQGDQPTATLLLDGDKAVIARFGPARRTLTLVVAGEGVINADSSAPYVHNQSVQLTAIPQPGWRFTGWAGDLTGQQNPIPVVLDRDKIVTANFVVSVGGVVGVDGGASHVTYLPLVTR